MIQLPSEYIQFVELSETLYGETDLEFGSYFDLEPLETVAQLNSDIEIEKYAPGFIAFASDGGGEIFVFDQSGAIFLLPLIGMEPNAALKIANSWDEFQGHIQTMG